MGAPSIEIIGHRGHLAHYPENCLEAIEETFHAGCKAVEVDVLLTKDGVPILYHDYQLNRTICRHADGRELEHTPLIKNLTLNEIRQLDCGSKCNPEFPRQKLIPGAKIPTLEELLLSAKDKNVRLILEIKRDPNNPSLTPPIDKIIQAVMRLILEKGRLERICISSFDPTIVEAVKKGYPKASVGFIFEKTPLSSAAQQARKIGADTLFPDEALLKRREDVKNLQNFRVIPWSVNDFKRYQELAAWGVDGIITDDYRLFCPKRSKPASRLKPLKGLHAIDED